MNLVLILHKLATDQHTAIVATLIVADFVFGVLAAIKTRTFNLKRIADFFRDDVLGKVLPWASVFIFSRVATGDAVLGVNWSTAEQAGFGALVAYLAASVLTSFQDLGLPLPPVAAKIGIGRAADLPQTYPADAGDRPPA